MSTSISRSVMNEISELPMQLPERFLRVPRGDSGFQPITAGHQVTTGSATCAGPLEAGHSVGAHFYAVRLADCVPIQQHGHRDAV